MVQEYSILNCADNTGARKVMCFRILGGTKRKYAKLGDTVVVSVKDAQPNSGVKRGDVAPGRDRSHEKRNAPGGWVVHSI